MKSPESLEEAALRIGSAVRRALRKDVHSCVIKKVNTHLRDVCKLTVYCMIYSDIYSMFL